jgi:hypothetical protein
MPERLDMQKQLRIQSEIRKREGDLITDVQRLIDCPYACRRGRDGRIESCEKYDPDKHAGVLREYIYTGKILEEKQMRNVLDVALETGCVEVIEVFIKYQIGRSSGYTGWKFGDFGKCLAQRIGKDGFVHREAGEIARKLKVNDRIDSIWLQLTQLYLGHLNRYYYYQKKKDE